MSNERCSPLFTAVVIIVLAALELFVWSGGQTHG
jgi:hypothetical protein